MSPEIVGSATVGDILSFYLQSSHVIDEPSKIPRRFLVNVDDTLAVVLEQEDTDRNAQISITDAGPKLFSLGTASSNGYNAFDIRVRITLYEDRILTLLG